MKRLWIVLFALLLSLSLFGCAKQETTYTVSKNGIEFHVDSTQKTISDGDNIYQYEFSGDSSSFNVTITYPNGSSYWYSQSGGMGQGGWSDDYIDGKYLSGDTLIDVLQEKAPKSAGPGKITGAIILIGLGIFDVIFPKVSWYLGYGWRYKNAEPSDAALTFARVGGAIAIIIGFILMLS